MKAADGNLFLGASGFQAGAALKLAQRGATLTATFVDQSGVTQSLDFSTVTSTAATLAATGQAISGFEGLCVMGVGVSNESFYPALLDLTAGALTYQAGTVFLTAEGNVHVDAGPCGPESSPAGVWIICDERQGGALATVDGGAPPASSPWPVGQYGCSSQVAAYGRADGFDQYVSSGGSGTLTLTEASADLTARYSGDSWLSGALRLLATTSTTANAESGQSLMAPCTVPLAAGGGPLEALPISAASLTVDDSTLFLSFAGTMPQGSSCAGAQVAGSVICLK